MKISTKILNNIFGNKDNFSLEHRLFIFTNLIGMIFSTSGMIINFIIGADFLVAIIPLPSVFILGYLYYKSRFCNTFNSLILPFILTCLATIISTWFYNGGWDGPSGLLYFDIMMITIIISKENYRLFIAIIFLIILLALTLIQFLYPSLLVYYHNDEARFIDIFLNVIYAVLVLYALINYLLVSYNNERIKVIQEKEKLDVLNSELKEKNKLISEQIIELEELNQQLKNTNFQITQQNKELEALNNQHSELNYKISLQNFELENLNKELKIANDAKDKFFSIISHDLKNPIGALRNYIELLHYFNQMTEEKKSEIINSLNKTVTFVIDLLENLLNWSRAQLNRIEFNPQKYNVSQIINIYVDLFEPLLSKKNIKVKKNYEFNNEINIDKNLFNTVIRNLLSNAIKFTYENGLITLSIKKYDNEYALITIEDTGIGISEEDIQKLFKIDVHHSTIGTSKEKGTGLGLILCKEFIEKHKGKIWVQSQVGVGSKFNIILPIN